MSNEKMTEEMKFMKMIKAFLDIDPGIPSAMKMRNFIEKWLEYKIDMLPVLNSLRDKNKQEFFDIIKGAQ